MKLNKFIVITLCLVVIVTSTTYSFFKTPHTTFNEDSKYLHNKSVKTILLWNNFFEYKHMGQGVGHTIFHQNNCSVKDCYIWDIEDGNPGIAIEDFDLVWFHGMDVPKGTLLRTKPPRRKPHQRYLFYLLEAPTTFLFDLKPLNGFFNWTATYRRDSDIFHPYGVLKRKSDNSVASEKWLEPTYGDVVQIHNKTKILAWIVSNCVKVPSNRDVYAEELAKHIEIDIFGECGRECDYRCSDKGMEDTYKFYLAFENSACVDYVTEKFFRTLKMNVVPVVFGGADYKTIAPPMSYINANDYDSPKDLANYLKYLDKNAEEYAKYFWWKKYYVVGESTNIVCQVCELLYKNEENQVKSDLEVWWNGPEVCRSPVEAGIGTWVGRSVNYPGQMVKYSAIKLLSTGNYAVILFIFILIVMFCYFILICAIKAIIVKVWSQHRHKIKYGKLYIGVPSTTNP